MRHARSRVAILLLAAALVVAGRSQDDPTSGPTLTTLTARPTAVAEGDVVAFEVAAEHPEASPLRYGWEFGDGTTLPPEPHAHRTFAAYRDDGDFEATVVVEDAAGRTARGTVRVSVRNVAPEVVRVDRSGAALEGGELVFHARAADPGDDRLSYAWDFGDGTVLAPSADRVTVRHAYDAAGAYPVTLVVDDGDGGTATWSEVVTVGAGFRFEASGALATLDGRGEAPFVAGLPGLLDADGQVRSVGNDGAAGCFVIFGGRSPTLASGLVPGVSLTFTAFLPDGLEEGAYPIGVVRNELPVPIVGAFEREWAAPGTFFAHAGAIVLRDGAPVADTYHGAGGTVRVHRFEGDVLEATFSVSLEETLGPLDTVEGPGGAAFPPPRTARANGTLTHRVRRTLDVGSLDPLVGSAFGDGYLCAPTGRFEVEEVVPPAPGGDAGRDVALVDFADPEIAVRFSEAVDPESVVDSVVLEWRRADGAFERVPILVMGDGDRGLILSPLSDLMDGVVYRARVAGGREGTRGRDGEVLDADREWLFETIVDLGEERNGLTLATTQVARDAPLVADKPTELRVYLNWREKPQVHPEWQTRYATFEVAVDGSGQPARRVRVKRMDLYGAEERKHALDSVNLYGWRPDGGAAHALTVRATQLGRAGAARTFETDVEVRGAGTSPALVFDYYFVRVGSWSGGIPIGERLAGHRIVRAGATFTEQTFPVPVVTARYRGDVRIDEPDEPIVEVYGEQFFLTSLASVMRRDEDAVDAFAARLGATDANVVVALLPPDVLRLSGYAYRALGTDPRIVAVQVDRGAEAPERYLGSTVAHEIGHTYGLEHDTDCPDLVLCSETGRSDAVEGTRIAEGGRTGWNKSRWSGNAEVGRTPGVVFSLMHPSSVLDVGEFITNADYAKLQAALPARAAGPAVAAPSDAAARRGPVHVQAARTTGLRVTGWIDARTGQAGLHRTVRASGPATSRDVAGAAYRVEARSVDGTVVGRAAVRPIPADPWHPVDGAEERLAFDLFVPTDAAATSLALLRGDTVLARRQAGAGSPSLAFVAGPRTVAGPIEVAWTASDPDGDALTFDVDYAPDGRDWRPLAVGVREPSVVLDPAALTPGPDPALRVVASDGFHEALASTPLAVDATARVLATEPAAGGVAHPRAAVTVWTSGPLAAVGPDALVVERLGGGEGPAARVAGGLAELPGGHGVRLVPAAPLAPGTSYRATFAPGAAPVGAGVPLTTWTFTTGDGPPIRAIRDRDLTGGPLTSGAGDAAPGAAGLPGTCAGLPRARWAPLLPEGAGDVVVEEAEGRCRITLTSSSTPEAVRSFAERAIVGNALFLTANRGEEGGARLGFRGAGLTGEATVAAGPPTRLEWTLRPE